MRLLAVPNFSEGRDRATIAALEAAVGGADLRAVHADEFHNRTVLTVAGSPRELTGALLTAARVAIDSIDMRAHNGLHPCVGALDVCPIVFASDSDQAEAAALAREIAEALADQLELPVFFYGDLAPTPEHAERAFLRRGGADGLARRMDGGELVPDAGPRAIHPTAGATLVTARPPLAAFNVELSGGSQDVARWIASRVRESGDGLPGVRALGLELGDGTIQISTNVHDPVAVPLVRVVEQVERLAAEQGARIAGAELVGLVPAAAIEGWPIGVALRGYDPKRSIVELALEG